MRQLTIISGSGINHGIAKSCPSEKDFVSLSYLEISESVYKKISPKLPPDLQNTLTDKSFDGILDELITALLPTEKVKQPPKEECPEGASVKKGREDVVRELRPKDFKKLIFDALMEIERELSVSTGALVEAVRHFDSEVVALMKKYDSINYYTLNYDAIFDHVIYGEQYSRKEFVTDYWSFNGDFFKKNDSKVKIMHLHGDLRYKPLKVTKYNPPTNEYPLLVVGSREIKEKIIASSDALRYYSESFSHTFDERGEFEENNLLILGLGFREEDEHIVSKIKSGILKSVFDKVVIYDFENKLKHRVSKPYYWCSPVTVDLRAVFKLMATHPIIVEE